MLGEVYTCEKAFNRLNNVCSESNVVEICLVKNYREDPKYKQLADLLGVNGDNEIREGYYLIQSTEKNPIGQKLHVTISQSEMYVPENYTPDIILTVDIKAGETLDLSAFWVFNKNSSPRKAHGVQFVQGGLIENKFSHTYEQDYNGNVKIYNYSLIKAISSSAEAGNKFRITDIEFKKPQIMENTQFLFKNFSKTVDTPNGEQTVGLRTVKGEIYFSETYVANNPAQLFYATTTLTSLKDFTIVCSSRRPINLTSVFMNSNLNDSLLQEINFVNLKVDDLQGYSQTFSGTKIATVNNKLVGKNATNFYGAFEGTNVQYIPAGILDNCTRGTRAFCVSKVSNAAEGVTLKSLKVGTEMFSGCPMSYVVSKRLYDTLPQATGAVMPTNRNDEVDYFITFACIQGEEEQIAQTFGIPANNPNTSAPWTGGYGIPKAEHGQFWLSPKGWYITFAHE